jgi:ABC-type sulfate transport system, permease component
VLGASWWQLFRRVTLPNIKWALIYGVILTNARAIGEFGAVAVVSGSIRGQTNTLPLQVQLLYEDYQTQAAFACASLLAFMALATLALKALVEWRQHRVYANTAPIDEGSASTPAHLTLQTNQSEP